MEKTTIIISGLPGSGKSTLGKLLAKKLGFEHFTIGKIFKSIGRGALKNETYGPRLIEMCKEKNLIIPEMNSPNDSEATELVWKSEIGQNKKFHEVLDNLQKELAKKGDIIIDGKLAIHMVGESGLKIWMTASKQIRVERTAERDSLTLEEANKYVENRERLEKEHWINIYNFNPLDQEKEADLVLDSTNQTPEELAEIVIEKLK